MESRAEMSRAAPEPPRQSSYPLEATAAYLNEKLGLYLSKEQQRGFATGLLIGTALGAALLAWNLMSAIRRSL